MPLKNQVAVITGASSGIGEAVAKDLHAAGVKLVVTARRADRLESLGKGITCIAGDITDPAMPQRLIDTAIAKFGSCDIVFNNAGLLEVARIETIDIDKVCFMARVNVEAAFRLMYTALKHFKKVGKGHLLNTSSVMGTKVRPTAGAYAGTKWAIEGLSEALRMELAGTAIKVSCIEPGLVKTELHRDWPAPASEVLNVKTPLTPEDIARCVRFILEQPEHVRIPRMMMLPGEHQI